jgi:hypothetical protein
MNAETVAKGNNKDCGVISGNVVNNIFHNTVSPAGPMKKQSSWSCRAITAYGNPHFCWFMGYLFCAKAVVRFLNAIDTDTRSDGMLKGTSRTRVIFYCGGEIR